MERNFSRPHLSKNFYVLTPCNVFDNVAEYEIMTWPSYFLRIIKIMTWLYVFSLVIENLVSFWFLNLSVKPIFSFWKLSRSFLLYSLRLQYYSDVPCFIPLSHCSRDSACSFSLETECPSLQENTVKLFLWHFFFAIFLKLLLLRY